MRKSLLITTCFAALSALTAIGASQTAIAQQTDQQKHETSGSEHPAVKGSTETKTPDTAAKPDAMSKEKRAMQDKTEKTDKEKTGQAGSKDAKPEGQAGEAQEKSKNEMRSKENAQDDKDATHTTGTANRDGAKQGRELDERQASDLRQRLQKEGRGAETTVNFDVRIGVNVPETVILQELPAEVVVEYPQFRGYDFVMVQDQIIIVDPQSRGVVEVVGGPPAMRAAAVNPCSTTQ
jgi:hypothetical protein